MGTHPIFESDFDCLTDWLARPVNGYSWIGGDRHIRAINPCFRPTSISISRRCQPKTYPSNCGSKNAIQHNTKTWLNMLNASLSTRHKRHHNQGPISDSTRDRATRHGRVKHQSRLPRQKSFSLKIELPFSMGPGVMVDQSVVPSLADSSNDWPSRSV